MSEAGDQRLVFDLDLIARYDQSGPRYTSYPTAVQFTDAFGESDYRQAALESNASRNPLSLYFHIPFCDTVCFYCACNKIATKDRSKSEEYLGRLFREIAMQGELFDKSRTVGHVDLHRLGQFAAQGHFITGAGGIHPALDVAGGVLEDHADIFRQLSPLIFSCSQVRGGINVTGDAQILLNLVEFGTGDVGVGIFLAVDNPGL